MRTMIKEAKEEAKTGYGMAVWPVDYGAETSVSPTSFGRCVRSWL